MSKTIKLEVSSFSHIKKVVERINELVEGNNVESISYTQTQLFKGEVTINLSAKGNIIEVPVRQGKGNGASQYRGVYWDKRLNKWRAYMQHNGKRYHLGTHASEIDAAKAYDNKAFELLGKDAYLNFVGDKNE